MPSYYSNVQEKYWSVGLFGYWKLKKIPFFLIAAPTLGFVFYGALSLLINFLIDKTK